MAEPHVRGGAEWGGGWCGIIHCVADPQVKEIRSIAQTAIGNKQTTPPVALCHIQFFNSCNPYPRERLASL